MWRNWAGNQAMTPAAVTHPASTEEVVRLVQDATRAGRRVKAIGSGHSFTAIGLTDGVLVHLDRMDRVLDVDRQTCRVTVQAGLTLRRLNAQLARHGLGLTNMGDVDAQTVSGAISTGTHCTGRSSAALAVQVVGLELVLADGTVRTCSAEQDGELFAAARLGLGALGIVTAVTLQAEPAFLLRADERPLPLDEVVADLDRHVADHDHFELYWFPHTDVALTKSNDRTAGPAQPLGTVRALLEDEVVGNGVFGLTCRVGRAFPAAVPRINRAIAAAASPRTYVDAAPHVFTAKRRVRFCEMEYAVPREALLDVLRELRGLPERHGQRISFPVEVRVAPADDVPLSTASGRDTAYVAVHVFRGTDFRPYFDAVESLMGSVGGRPHWGKLHGLASVELRERYPRFDEFVAVRDRLDPERRFCNAYLERVLGA